MSEQQRDEQALHLLDQMDAAGFVGAYDIRAEIRKWAEGALAAPPTVSEQQKPMLEKLMETPAPQVGEQKSREIPFEEMEFRKLLWFNHARYLPYVHTPYGDDGEMQCCGIDFKRWSSTDIADHLCRRSLTAPPSPGATSAEGSEPSDETEGIYRKYEVRRLNDPDGKHVGCNYFVLDLVHDKFSKPALRAYAKACERDFPELAKDLRQMIARPLVDNGQYFPNSMSATAAAKMSARERERKEKR